jgi:hypothetical protein
MVNLILKHFIMKKLAVLLLCLCHGLTNLNAQFIQIVVQNGPSESIYTNLTTAVSNAQNGDTIYIPGGGFSVGTLVINANQGLKL